jgi:hypothetical protein
MSFLLTRSTRRRQLRELDSPEQERLVRALRDEVSGLPASPAEDGSPWWTGVRERIVAQLLADDPRSFLTWKPIRETMFTPNLPYVETELEALKRSAEWSATWEDVLEEDPAGCPPPFPALPSSSSNLIHHAYHVHRLRETTGRSLEDFGQIVEFGGGYGSFARLAGRLAFRGRYHVYDFPEFAALQRYYLGSVASTRHDAAIADQFAASPDASDVPPGDPTAGLFVALWSLSETPVAQREPWIAAMRSASSVLLAFQHEFEGADNRAWFAGLTDQIPELDWVVAPIEHLPGHSYAIASRRSA